MRGMKKYQTINTVRRRRRRRRTVNLEIESTSMYISSLKGTPHRRWNEYGVGWTARTKLNPHHRERRHHTDREQTKDNCHQTSLR